MLSQNCKCIHVLYTVHTCTVRVKKKAPIPFRFSSRFNRSGPVRSVPFTSVLTVYRGQTVLALGMNSSAKFTACVGEA